MRVFVAALCLWLSVAGASAPLFPSPDDWRDITIYQIVTDRWDDGDPLNNTANPDGNRGVHGGDFAGLTRRLGYLEGLGVGAVWISPVPLNVSGAYHGYHARDFRVVDPHWGTEEELRAFIDAAHARGIRTVLDVVCNHGGNLIHSEEEGWPDYRPPPEEYVLSWIDERRYPAPFDDLSLFQGHGRIPSWTFPEQELGELARLDDLRTEDPRVREEMIDIWTDWVLRLDADAFRIDTVKHVEMEFWQAWAPAVRERLAAAGKTNFFMFGEVLDGNPEIVGRYTGRQAGGPFVLESCLDYPLFFTTNEVFGRATAGAASIEALRAEIPQHFDPASHDRLVTFLDNHDMPRFLAPRVAGGEVDRLSNALVFMLTSRGVPTIYYGTEQAFAGAQGERRCSSREDMFDGPEEEGPSRGDNFDQTASLYRLVRRLNQFRRDHPALRRGDQIAREVHAEPGIYSYSRLRGDEEVLVVLNTDPAAAHVSADLETSFPEGAALVDLLDPTFTVTVRSTGVVGPISLAPSSHRVLVAVDAVTNLEPEVIVVSPEHDTPLAPLSKPLVLKFSEPMDQDSVEAAFSMDPPVRGETSWNKIGDTLTFTPTRIWPQFVAVSVRVGPTATDLDGAPLRGGFESVFMTDVDISLRPELDPPLRDNPAVEHLIQPVNP